MKTIVTHFLPDLDAVTSCWLIHRFMPDWKGAEVEFVSSGQTLDNLPPDDDEDILHVDTGMGKFDHHQGNEITCAAKLVFEHLLKKHMLKTPEIKPLGRLIEVVTRYDHFREVDMPQADDDMYNFSLNYMISGLHLKYQDNGQVVKVAEDLLDALFIIFKNKCSAENVLKKATQITTKWGRTLTYESENDDTMKLAFLKGYDMAIRKSRKYGFARIKIHPNNPHNLEPIYEILKVKDPHAQWFYHKSGKMLLNGSSKANRSRPTSFSLKELVEIISEIK